MPHRKNAAEWIMWIFWFPATRLRRWYRELGELRQLGLAVGCGCWIGGIWQGADVGHGFMGIGTVVLALAILSGRSKSV